MRELVGAGTPREAVERVGTILFRICLENAATAVFLIIVGAVGAIVAAVVIMPAP